MIKALYFVKFCIQKKKGGGEDDILTLKKYWFYWVGGDCYF